MTPSNPERDLRVARQVRHGWRNAQDLGDALGALRNSPEYKAMRRFAQVHGVLAQVLPAQARGKVRAISLNGGTLTLEVANAVLCGELRQMSVRPLLAALAAAGTGASRLAWRVAPRR